MSALYGYIAAGLAALAAIVGIWFKGRSSGKQAAEKEKLETQLAAEKHANEVNKTTEKVNEVITSASDDDVRKQLQDNWTKN